MFSLWDFQIVPNVLPWDVQLNLQLFSLTILWSESESVSPSIVSNSLRVPWMVAHQAPLSMEFSRQEYWRGLHFPSSGDLPDPRIEPMSPTLQADSLPFKLPRKEYTVEQIYVIHHWPSLGCDLRWKITTKVTSNLKKKRTSTLDQERH